MSLFDGRNQLLTMTAVIFFVHEIVYFTRFLPFWLCDFVPAFQKYKIQQIFYGKRRMAGVVVSAWSGRLPYASAAGKAFRGVLFSHFFIQLPMMLFFDPVAEAFGMKVTDVPFPGWRVTVKHLAVFFVFEDFFHYWMHRALHWGYGNFQTAEYAHPVETFILGFGTLGGPLLWAMLTGDLHIVTVITWMVFRMIQAIDAHSGYDFPWSLRRWFPLWSGAEFHDYHHEAFVNNYATSFRFWDWLCGTDVKYKAHRARQRAAKAEVSARPSTASAQTTELSKEE
ncbi:MAG: hypothetical protein BJ554DRAFT_5686 [Olpidium bornovanus]|uniref:Fatty acid hydroxylase domain-containing protein n=1 Tax=Olpidium bornovanus TaxID=278681 RepID=A0A8H7ZZ46_9FUNG|nr:MAG: hypothetical protein BJ554DRAFT_5686 [Olpidium bornovanus]